VNTRIKQSIIAYAQAAPEQEVCGFIYQDEAGVHVHPCENITRDEAGPARAFEIDPQEYMALSRRARVCGIYHSHSKGGAHGFSPADLTMANAMELPIHLYVVDTGAWISYVPRTYSAPLIGANWAWGEADCYELVRTYYRNVKGIYLSDYDRDESFQDAPESAITQYVADEGFSPVVLAEGKAPQEGDVLLFGTPGNAYPHHLGVYIGKQTMLHHPLGSLSRSDPIDGKWLKRLKQVLRYTGKAQS